MSYEQLPKDEELFPHLGCGDELRKGYIEKAEGLRAAAIIPEGEIKNRDEYGEFLEKLIKREHQLWMRMEDWLIRRLLEGGIVDSFPPKVYTFQSFSVEKTTTTTTYDPYYDTEEESVRKDRDDLSIGINYFSELYETMLLFDKEEKEGKDLNDGSHTYALLKPLYQATHPYTLWRAIKRLFTPVIFCAVCLLLVLGLKTLSEATMNNPLISLPVTLAGWGVILVAIGGGIWLLFRVFGFFGDLIEVFSAPKIRRQAAANAPKVHRILRYYRLWEQEGGKNYRGVAMMDEYFTEYLKKYPISSKKRRGKS